MVKQLQGRVPLQSHFNEIFLMTLQKSRHSSYHYFAIRFEQISKEVEKMGGINNKGYNPLIYIND